MHPEVAVSGLVSMSDIISEVGMYSIVIRTLFNHLCYKYLSALNVFCPRMIFWVFGYMVIALITPHK